MAPRQLGQPFPQAGRIARPEKPYVTNVGYQSGDASMSIDLIPFIQGNTIILGGRYILNVNHEGHRPR